MSNIAAMPRLSAMAELFAGEGWGDGLCFAFDDCQALDLDGIAFTLDIRARGGQAPLLTFRSADDDMVTLGNILALTIPASRLVSLARGKYPFGLTATGVDGLGVSQSVQVVTGVLSILASP